MQKILVSRCLLGEKVRYDGNDQLIDHPLMKQWQEEGRIVGICPEVAGGAPIPRSPAEITEGDGHTVLIKKAKVMNVRGDNVTDIYRDGAKIALKLAKEHGIKIALLKENSPSCGGQTIYDGSFQGFKKQGHGVTAALLIENDIQVFNEKQLEEIAKLLDSETVEIK